MGAKINLLDILNPFFWEHIYVYHRASCLIDRGKYEEAKEYLRNFLRKKHYVTEAHYYALGQTYLNSKDYDTAEECFLTSLRYNPFNNIYKANTYFYLGLVYYESDNFQNAVENFQKSIDIKEKLKIFRDMVMSLPNLYCYLGRAYAQLNDFDEAFRSINKGLSYESNNEALQRELTILKNQKLAM